MKNSRKGITGVLKTLIAIALTAFYFVTDVRDKYNAFLIIAVFVIFILSIKRYSEMGKYVAMNKKVLCMICGLTLAITYLVGALIDFQLGVLLLTVRGIMRLAVYLFFRALLLSGLSFFVFTFFDGKRTETTSEIKNGWSLKDISWILACCWGPYCILHFPGRFGGGCFQSGTSILWC